MRLIQYLLCVVLVYKYESSLSVMPCIVYLYHVHACNQNWRNGRIDVES